MGSESTQKWVGRNRPPRVQIVYEVETGGALEKKELPFIVGILADLCPGRKERTPLKTSRFVEIDRDNFDKVLEGIGPQATFVVDNHIDPSKKKLAVDITFRSIADFDPLNVIDAVPELNALLKTRRALVDLGTKLYGNDALEGLLRKLGQDKALATELGEALALPAPAAPAAGDAAQPPS